MLSTQQRPGWCGPEEAGGWGGSLQLACALGSCLGKPVWENSRVSRAHVKSHVFLFSNNGQISGAASPVGPTPR